MGKVQEETSHQRTPGETTVGVWMLTSSVGRRVLGRRTQSSLENLEPL
jgi:hypothetical protein